VIFSVLSNCFYESKVSLFSLFFSLILEVMEFLDFLRQDCLSILYNVLHILSCNENKKIIIIREVYGIELLQLYQVFHKTQTLYSFYSISAMYFQQILDHVHCQLIQMLANSMALKHLEAVIWNEEDSALLLVVLSMTSQMTRDKNTDKLEIMKWKTHNSKSLLLFKNWRLTACFVVRYEVFVPEVLALLVTGVVEKPESYGQQITTGRGLARNNGKGPEWNLQSECIIGALMLIVLNDARVLEFFIMASSLTRCTRVLQTLKYNIKFVNTWIFFLSRKKLWIY